jgi:acetylornithine deacetylase/succinyl-diaminopimelate desuccinylase-like protein
MGVRSYIADRLSALGPLQEHAFSEGADAGINLIMRLEGKQNDLPPLIVGAHYDGPLHSIGATSSP